MSAASFKALGTNSKFNKNAVVGVPATSEAVTYIASVAVGNPSTSCQSHFLDFTIIFTTRD